MTEPLAGPRICDCPCHRGADVFHIVSCCGSVLGRRPTREAGAPPLLILLHGIGSNEEDLIGLEPYLDERFLIVSARAPFPYGWGGYAWFEIQWMPDRIAIDRAQAEQSRDLLVRFIGETVAAYGADPAAVVRSFAERARLLHIKDGPADKPESPMTAVGEGVVDVAAISAASRAEWHIVELDRCATDMFAAVEKSHAYMTRGGFAAGKP